MLLILSHFALKYRLKISSPVCQVPWNAGQWKFCTWCFSNIWVLSMSSHLCFMFHMDLVNYRKYGIYFGGGWQHGPHIYSGHQSRIFIPYISYLLMVSWMYLTCFLCQASASFVAANFEHMLLMHYAVNTHHWLFPDWCSTWKYIDLQPWRRINPCRCSLLLGVELASQG